MSSAPLHEPAGPPDHETDRVLRTVGLGTASLTGPLIGAIAAQAPTADATRTVDPQVIDQIKSSGALGLVASTEIGGGGGSIRQMAAELAAVAGACASTAWCVWNHWSVFHLFVGALGPEHRDLLRQVVTNREWACFGAGAGSRVFGRIDGDEVVLDGRATFASSSRYADWTGVAFAVGDGSRPPTPDELRFSILRLDSPGVSIEPTWDGASLRASSTDTVHYQGVRVPLGRCTTWYGANRAVMYRDRSLAVIHDRYREDWVGLSDLWLGAMAVGLSQAALVEACEDIEGRKAIMGATMANFVTVQVNLGNAAALVATARAAIEQVCDEVDRRIGCGQLPTEADFQRQCAVSATAVGLCQQAMGAVLQSLGGNGLREGGRFERRWRDLAAMPVHINAHPDRIHTRVGQYLLGLEASRF
ncbi:MAG: acyl-CoA dehydrogenase family protein [Acidimicrobiales bacterium]